MRKIDGVGLEHGSLVYNWNSGSCGLDGLL